MKNFVKLLGIIALVAVIGFSFVSCSNGTTGGGGGGGTGGGGTGGGTGGGGTGGTGGGTSTASVKFNLSGAKAIIASEGGGSGSYSVIGRAAYGDQSTLFKILENNSIEPIFSGSQQMPKVRYLFLSPVAGKKDLYVCFEHSWWTDGEEINGEWKNGEEIGQFIHVKEDGSIVNVAGFSDGGTWSYMYYDSGNTDIPVSFDQNGNLYFIVSESSGSSYTNVIFKYNPVTGKKDLLTGRVPNTSYHKMELSSDGTYIIARGSRWSNNSSADFLRLIPTANPDNFANIYYSSGGGGWIGSFAHNSQKKELYIYGNNLYNDGSENWQSGLFKLFIGGFTQNDWQWTTLFNNNNSYFSYPVTYSWNYESQSSVYSWQNEYLTQGNPDYAKIVEALKNYFKSDLIEFRYNSLTDTAALASLTQDDLRDIYSYSNGQIEFFKDNCYRTGTNTRATDVSSYYSDLNRIFLAPSDNYSIWSSVGSYNNGRYKGVFARLINSNGQRDFYVPQGMTEKIVVSMKPSASHLYFLADKTNTSYETGYHDIYRFSFTNPDFVENLFDQISQNIEVFSFDIGGDYLYFGGVQGTNLLTGKIDLNTHVYTPMQFGQKISAVLIY